MAEKSTKSDVDYYIDVIKKNFLPEQEYKDFDWVQPLIEKISMSDKVIYSKYHIGNETLCIESDNLSLILSIANYKENDNIFRDIELVFKLEFPIWNHVFIKLYGNYDSWGDETEWYKKSLAGLREKVVDYYVDIGEENE